MQNGVHWFPGHMKKASIKISEKLKIVDCVIELLDARIPFSSRNVQLFELTKSKNRLIVLTKQDLADEKITSLWINFFKSQGYAAIFADLNQPNDIKRIISNAEKLGEEKHQKQLAKGMKIQPIRAMIIGIPNVGKSTLINKIANRKAASVQNKPGHTKAQQWIKVSNKFELLDTPGILQSSYEDKQKTINLALVGSVNENILPEDELSLFLLDFLKKYYPSELKQKYNLLDVQIDNREILNEIAQRRGLINKSGLDIARASKLLLNEFKNGKIGRMSLEREVKCL